MNYLNLIFVALSFFSLNAQAYYTTMESGQLVKAGQYKLGVETQFLTSRDDGVNLAARFDGPINEELNWKALLGFGTTDFFMGGFVKWVPFPDTDTQPAIGVTAGATYAHYERHSEISLRAHPFVSKLFESEIGDFNPFVSLPIGIRSYDDDTQVPIHLALGSEFRSIKLEKVKFVAEIGINLSKAFSYFSIGAQFSIDEEAGFELR